VYREEVS